MKLQSPLYAIYVALAVVVSATLAIAIGSREGVKACNDGRIATEVLASPIDGNAAAISDGKIVPISAGYEGHEKIAEAARSSNFKFFHVPLLIRSACKPTERNGALYLVVEDIEELIPISDTDTFDRTYADFGIEPVKL